MFSLLFYCHSDNIGSILSLYRLLIKIVCYTHTSFDKINSMPDITTSSTQIEHEKLQKIIAEVKEGVIIADPNQNISLMNKSAEELTGFGFVDVMGKPIKEVLKIAEGENEIPVDTFCPVGGLEVKGVVFQRKNLKLTDRKSAIRIVNLTSQKIKEGSNAGLGCIITIEDTYGETELERMKLDFVSMSVHVLRTPLSILKGYLSFLNKQETTDKLNDQEKTYITNSIISVNDLIELVENLLDLTEVQNSGYRVNPAPLDLDKAVKNVVMEYREAADSKGLRLMYAPSLYELPLVSGDATRIKIVLRNLVGNAIKFTNEGFIQLSVLNNMVSEGFLLAEVKDTGKGIPERNLPKLFQKFYRVKEALEMELGSGLGLYISRRIIESHGGKIWVESREGHGSTFYFTLPIYKPDKRKK